MNLNISPNSIPEWLDISSPESVVLSVTKRFRAHKFPFVERINVEDWVPGHLGREEKARFILFSTSVDYGMKSPILYRGMLNLLMDNPNALEYSYLSKIQQSDLAKLLKNYLHLRWPNDASRYFIENAHILKNKYNDNPLAIYRTSKGQEVIDRLKKFYGFGKKTTFLCFRATLNVLRLQYPDVNELSMPIDRHKLKFTYLLGYINKQDFLNKKIDKVSNVWINACNNVGISWLEFDRAFWIFSRWFNAGVKLN